MLGLFYYGYSPFSLVAGAALDGLGPRKVVPIGAAAVGIGALLFASGNPDAASLGRFLQGAGGAVRVRRRRLHRDDELRAVEGGDADRRDADVRHGGRVGRSVRGGTA